MTAGTIREPAVAGMFYPDDRVQLSDTVDLLLEEVTHKPTKGTLVALIAPHAGYQYSGPTAAAGYKLAVNKSFDAVVIVSPSHREYFDGVSVYEGAAYSTPLGRLVVDGELRQALLEGETLVECSIRGHREEHAIEVHLPFLQKALGDVKILPIVMGDQRREYCYHLGDKLGTILEGRKALLVASTDLSHYHPYAIAKALDKIIVSQMARFDYHGMMEDLEAERTEACGGGPAVAVLAAAARLGADRVQILHQCNSGDITGDHSGVVGYVSAAVFRTN